MLASPSEFKHIVLSEDGVAYVQGTRMKVRLLALDHLTHGWSAAELKWQYPHLSMAQIHAALAYYYDHQSEMDAATQAEFASAEQSRSAGDAPFTRKDLERRHPD